MDADRRERIESLFEAALELPSGERDAWLAAAVKGDDQLGAEVRALLAAHARAEGLLERDAPEMARSLEAGSRRERRIGPYRVLREIGRGGMGIVYLAERDDGQFRRRVAIKLLRSGGDAEELHRRFLAERQILASLDHPNIAQLLDGGVTDGLLPFLVMEYVEGMPITDYCDRNGLRIGERLRLFQAVCAAVDHAHQNLVIHRDLKPSNVLVTAAGQVKLLDFGIAKLLNPGMGAISSPVTRTQYRVLTPEYASPEQIRGDPLTTKSDVYSLGVLLYEILAGHSPYRTTRGTSQEVVGAVVSGEPDRPSTRVGSPRSVTFETGTTGEVPPETIAGFRGTTPERLRRLLRGDLDAIVLMALRKEPGRRYASAAAMAQDIGRHLSREPVLAHRGSRTYRAGKLLRRHAVESVAAALAAAALVGGAGFAFWQAGLADRERARAEQALVQTEEALALSREVTAFLMGLFEANDPTAARGDLITARELLDRGIARSDELAGQPLLQAQLLDVIGRVSISLGQYERARDLLQSALAIRRELLGSSHPDLAATLHGLATVLRLEGQYTEAELLYREALAIRREVLGANDPAVGVNMQDVGLVLHLRGDLEGAENMYRQALDLERRALGEEHPDVIRLESLIGVVLRDRGDRDAAEEVLRRTLAVRRRVLGEIHPEVAIDLLQLGTINISRNDPAGADSLFRQALAIRRQLYGDEHPTVAHTLVQLAIAAAERGELDAAGALYEEGIAMQRRLLGDEHPFVANSLNSLGLLWIDRGDLDEAERVFREAIVINERAYDGDHPYAAFPMEGLARVLRSAGRLDEAETLLRATLGLRRRVLGDVHPLVAQTALRLAEVLHERRRYREAEPFYLQALGFYQQRDDATEVEGVRAALVELYTALEETAEVERYRGQ